MAKFTTKARAVDMLGRQQIADASTAISELFKNAHDAYADHAEVDYFKSDGLLMIRDDGTGMTPEEFEQNWLVLGTDSKLSGARPPSGPPPGKVPRAIMGEKGIGRLAIAFLGRQVLVITRSGNGGAERPLTLCYVHWGLFDQPGLNLDDIEIPIRVLSNKEHPSGEVVSELMAENATNIKRLQQTFPDCTLDRILEDIDDFQVDPANIIESVGGLTLAVNSHGTHFYVAPADDVILDEIRAEQRSETKEFSKCLLGFCNPTFSVDSPPLMETAFRFWPTDSRSEDLISPNEFFTKEDLSIADHFVSGIIDAHGQFQGLVRVYDQEYPDHVISWKEGQGKMTAFGPVRVEFGYLQGESKVSMAEPEEWAALNAKLKQIGGLYVYRDGIRILPYGNSDIDWLDIELRRNKGMTHYFFSYRRIYGAVCLTRSENSTLREKAGREGFQKDKAYRQFKSVLENLFLQLAADFFRKEAPLGDYFQERKEELDRLDLARQKREKQTTTKRKKLGVALDVFFQRTQESIPEAEIVSLRQHVQHRMQVASEMEDQDEAAAELLDAEKEANTKLSELRTSYAIAKPRGVALTKQLTRDWEAFQQERARLEESLFVPFAKEVGETLGRMASQAKIYIDQRRRLQSLIETIANEQSSLVQNEAKELNRATSDAKRAAVKTAREALRELRDAIESVHSDLARRDLNEMDSEHIEAVRCEYEQRIDAVASKNAETLGGVRELLAALAERLEESTDISELDIAEAMDAELQSLREQADTDEELVQLGLAVAVINHEFVAAIKMIRTQLRELRSWARANDDLMPIYSEMRTNFDHLDEHLNLFTPLQRRMYRKRIPIQGKQIMHYIRTLFSVRLDRHNIKIRATQSFLDSTIESFPSSIYPVFVNLVDNFIFWLTDASGDRVIRFDCGENCYLVGNNGPSIPARDAKAIFEQGFSRKPNGRGLGLYISQRVLSKENMAIALSPDLEKKQGIDFKISWSVADE